MAPIAPPITPLTPAGEQTYRAIVERAVREGRFVDGFKVRKAIKEGKMLEDGTRCWEPGCGEDSAPADVWCATHGGAAPANDDELRRRAGLPPSRP